MARNAISNILLRFSGEDKDAKATIAELSAQLSLFGNEDATATAEVKTKGEGTLASLQAKLAAFASQTFEATVKVKTDKSQLSNLDNIVTKEAEQGLSRFQALMQSASSGAKNLGSALGGTTVNLGLFGTKLGPLVGIVLAVAVAVGVSLVGALSLLVTAAAGAAVAIAGLAAAFAAALGPAVLVVVAAVAKIASILKIVTALDKAKTAESRKSAQGTDAASQAEEQRHQRLIAVRDALQGVTSAERGYRQAREAAKTSIEQANQAQSDAAQGLSAANAELKGSTVDAYHAMAQAARDATDALLGVKSAKLSVEEAKLSVKEAANELASFRKESGKASGSLDKMFKKFSDVNFKGNVQQGLQSLGLNEKESLKGESLILRLRRAKLNEQEANQRVKKSEDDLGQARARNNEFIKKGIAAYAPYVSALQGVKDATRRFAEATAEANKLQKQGIDQNPQVIAAHEALINAQERLKEARRQAALPIKTMPDDLAKAQQDFGKLSAAAQKFGLVILGIKKDLSKFGDLILQAMLPGLTKAIEHIRNIFGNISVFGPLLLMAKAVGDAINSFFASFDNQQSANLFGSLTLGGAELIKILGSSVFPNFIKLFLRIAAAFLPALVSGANKFGKALGRWNKNLKDGDLEGVVSTVLGLLSSLWKLGVAVAKVFLAFFKGSSGQAKSFVDQLTKIVEKFAAWLGSKDGQAALKQFFNDVIPLAKSFGAFIFQLITFFIKFTQVVAPAMSAMFDGFTLVLGIINKLLTVLRPVLQIAVLIGSAFFGGGFLGKITKVKGVFEGIWVLAKSIVSFPASLGGRIATLIGRFTAFTAAFEAFKGLIKAVISKVGSLFASLPGFARRAFNSILGILRSVVGRIATVAHGIAHAIAEALREAIAFVRKTANVFYEAGKAIITGLIKGIKDAALAVPKAVIKVAGKAVKGALKALGINSPSKVFMKIGVQTIEGLEKGLLDSKGRLALSMKNTIAPVIGDVNTATKVAKPRNRVADVVAAGAGTSIGDIILQTAEGGTPDGLTAARKLKRELKKRG